VTSKLEVGKKWAVIISFKNTGKTPARNVSMDNRLSAVNMEMISYSDLSQHMPRSIRRMGTVSPQGEISGTFDISELITIDETTARKLAEHRIGIFINGSIHYDDVFSKHHWLKYCYRVTSDGNYEACKEDNETDKD
jgi:hypothetical protein